MLMNKLNLFKYYVLIVFLFLISKVQAQDSIDSLLGTWVCDSVADKAGDEFSMINNLKLSFKTGGIAEVSISVVPNTEDSIPSTIPANWSRINAEKNVINLCMEHEQEVGRAEECEELFYRFISLDYAEFSDGKDPIYFRRE